MTEVLLALVVLQSPRQAETFTGTQMDRLSPRSAMVLPPTGRATNSFTWKGSSDADGYMLEQWSENGVTNLYVTTATNITISYVWPDSIHRWHYRVCATNEWGESDWTTNRVHNPPYAPDRMDLWVTGVQSFPLETSTDAKTWGSPVTSSRQTISLTGQRRFYRSPGRKLEVMAYNPLNQ